MAIESWATALQPRSELDPAALLPELGFRRADDRLVRAFTRLMSRAGRVSPSDFARAPAAKRRKLALAALDRRSRRAWSESRNADDESPLTKLEEFLRDWEDIVELAELWPREDSGLPEALARTHYLHRVVRNARITLSHRDLEAAIGQWAAGEKGLEEIWDEIQAAVRSAKVPCSARDNLCGCLDQTAYLMRKACRSRLVNFFEYPFVARALRARRWELHVKALALAQPSGGPRETMLAAMGRELPAERREWLTELKVYCPSLDPDYVAMDCPWMDHYDGSGEPWGGWTTRGLHPKLAFLAQVPSRLDEVETALHEGFHLGDKDRDLEVILKLLLGPRQGDKLDDILLEGYTELRHRRALLRLLSDGRDAKTEFARRFFQEADQEARKKGYKTPEGRLQAYWNAHLYGAWVCVVEAIAQAAGEEALEAITRGDVRPLEAALGHRRLLQLGALADLFREIPLDRGLVWWLARKMAAVATGTLDDAQLERIRHVVKAAAAAGRLPVLQRLFLVEDSTRLYGLDFERFLTRAEDPRGLRGWVKREAGGRSSTSRAALLRGSGARLLDKWLSVLTACGAGFASAGIYRLVIREPSSWIQAAVFLIAALPVFVPLAARRARRLTERSLKALLSHVP